MNCPNTNSLEYSLNYALEHTKLVGEFLQTSLRHCTAVETMILLPMIRQAADLQVELDNLLAYRKVDARE